MSQVCLRRISMHSLIMRNRSGSLGLGCRKYPIPRGILSYAPVRRLSRAVAPNSNLLVLRRGQGLDVSCFCHILRKFCLAPAEQEECDVDVADRANSLWRHCDMGEPAGDWPAFQ